VENDKSCKAAEVDKVRALLKRLQRENGTGQRSAYATYLANNDQRIWTHHVAQQAFDIIDELLTLRAAWLGHKYQ
jgi:hypothetical protein